MDFDFHGQIEDVDKDDEENPDSNEGEESEEISEKMGDLGNDPGDILDKNIWDPQEDEDQVGVVGGSGGCGWRIRWVWWKDYVGGCG